MRILKRILSDFYFYLMWALIAALFWVWMFGFLTDAPKEKKIVVFADVPDLDRTGLATELEKDKPDGITLIQTYPFSYALMSADELEAADIYIVKSGDITSFFDSFAPLPEDLYTAFDGEKYYVDDVVYGLKVYDRGADKGVATDYITYGEDDYFLFFNVKSVHSGSDTSVDAAAVAVATKLLTYRN